jgi:[acyl-carrier-protein] S-malonyltransferase
MSDLAFVFPGQGSQYAGMGRNLVEASTAAARVFEQADQALGFELSKLCFDGPESELALTEYTQPAVLATSAAVLAVLEEHELRPRIVAGHSLGEYTALVAAGSLELSDALKLVRKRGRYMQQAVPVGQGAMAAVLGLDAKVLSQLCEEAARTEVVVPANFNAPEQIVIAGHADAVRRAVALAEARGAKRAVMLQVSAPFHSPLMAPARERLTPDLEATEFKDLRIPMVANVDAQLVRRGEQARLGLVRQVDSPVLWVDSMRRLTAEGPRVVVEVGPGRVLTGLARRIDRSLELFSVEDLEGVDKLGERLRGGR